MTNEQLLNYCIQDEAKRHDLPATMVEAIILVESDNNLNAIRVEPAYRYLYDVVKQQPFRALRNGEVNCAKAPKDFPYLSKLGSRDTEWGGQRASWGPMQVMGAVARERGFGDPFPALCSNEWGVYWGCQHLSWLTDRYQKDYGWEGVISSYNQGSPRKDENGNYCNQTYVNKVLRVMGDLSTNGEKGGL